MIRDNSHCWLLISAWLATLYFAGSSAAQVPCPGPEAQAPIDVPPPVPVSASPSDSGITLPMTAFTVTITVDYDYYEDLYYADVYIVNATMAPFTGTIACMTWKGTAGGYEIGWNTMGVAVGPGATANYVLYAAPLAGVTGLTAGSYQIGWAVQDGVGNLMASTSISVAIP
jgi:hypothetical protein